jgi:hypothetical protein
LLQISNEMVKQKEIPITHLDPDSDFAQGLLKMLAHKKLCERFYAGEISLNELNRLLKEKNINIQYNHPHDV